jgi:trimethylguanosine synthase
MSLLASLPQELRRSITSKHESEAGQVQPEDRLEKADPEVDRPAKRQKINKILQPCLEKYDATGLVPFYDDYKQVPDHLKKCKQCAWTLISNV